MLTEILLMLTSVWLLPSPVRTIVSTRSTVLMGYKVWRARVTGVTAEAAGDAANPKKAKEMVEA